MSTPQGRPKEGSLPLGGTARSAKGVPVSTPCHPAAPLWRPHTSAPALLATAIIAVPKEFYDHSEPPAYLLPGIYRFAFDGWHEEITNKPLAYTRYWWADEEELLQGLCAIGKEETQP